MNDKQLKNLEATDWSDVSIRSQYAIAGTNWRGLSPYEQEALYFAAKQYYYDEDLGGEIMMDDEFDKLEQHLKLKKSDIIKMTNVGGGAGGKLIHTHLSPMLSLEKIQVNDEDDFPIGEILDWCQNKHFPMEATPKFDGTSFEAEYNLGKLIRVLSRGKNGKGADITSSMKKILPATINVTKHLEVRGEVLMDKKVFEKKYADKKLCRATVSGLVTSGDGIEDCVVVCYSLKVHEGSTYKYVKDTQGTLTRMGFNKLYPVKTFTINDKSDFRKAYNAFKEYREKDSPFFLDGHVIKMNEEERLEIGENNHHPKWAVAIKFPSVIVQTTITGVEWSTGYIGQVTPVGILKPVELDGSTVKRVSLYNWVSIAKSGTFPGAVVSIKKSGDIIPAIVSIILRSPDEKKFAAGGFFPTNCPSCNSKLRNDGSNLWCDNDSCVAKLTKKLCNGIDALGLKGVGESKSALLIDAGVETIFDFFNESKMSKKSLLKSFSTGSDLDKISTLPAALKDVDLENVIYALQFSNLGRTGSKFLAKMLGTTVAFTASSDFGGLERAVILPFTDKSSPERTMLREFIALLKSHGVKINLPKDTSSLIGMELTGSPSGSGFDKKDDFIKFMATKGFHHVGMKEAKVLVTDDLKSSSSKMTAAAKKNMLIVTYEDLAKNFDSIKAKL